MSTFISKMLEQADRVVHSRSSVLVPLQWLLIILAVFFLALIPIHAPAWAQIGEGVCFGLILILSVAAYVFFVIRNPDGLRSEQYSLSKYASEQGLYDDSDSGLIEGLPARSMDSVKLRMEATGRKS